MKVAATSCREGKKRRMKDEKQNATAPRGEDKAAERRAYLDRFLESTPARRPLSLPRLAFSNLSQRPSRSAALFFLTALLAFALMSASFLMISLQQGLHGVADRLGADLLIVPAGYEGRVRGAILRGEPSDVYFDEEVCTRVAAMPEVEAASPELYVQTLSASCCSFPLQLIGFDAEKSFTVQAWLKGKLDPPLRPGEIVVGFNIQAPVGDTLRFFGQEFKIRLRMDRTGSEFDNSVFMPVERARDLLAQPLLVDLKQDKKVKFDFKKGKALSTVLIRLKPGYDLQKTAAEINRRFKGEGVYALSAQTMMRETRDKFSLLRLFLLMNILILSLIVFAAGWLIYAAMLRERRGELASLRIVGASPSFVARLLSLEALFLSIMASVFGTFLSLILMLLLSQFLQGVFELPWLNPAFGLLALLALLITVLSASLAPLAVAKNARRLSRAEISDLLDRER